MDISAVDIKIKGDLICRKVEELMKKIPHSPQKSPSAEIEVNVLDPFFSLDDIKAENQILRDSLSGVNKKLRDAELKWRLYQTEMDSNKIENESLKKKIMQQQDDISKNCELQQQVKDMEQELTKLTFENKSLRELVTTVQRTQEDIRYIQNQVSQKFSEASKSLSASEDASRKGASLAKKQGLLLKSFEEKLFSTKEEVEKLKNNIFKLHNREKEIETEKNLLKKELNIKKIYYEQSEQSQNELKQQCLALRALLTSSQEIQSINQEVIEVQSERIKKLTAEILVMKEKEQKGNELKMKQNKNNVSKGDMEKGIYCSTDCKTKIESQNENLTAEWFPTSLDQQPTKENGNVEKTAEAAEVRISDTMVEDFSNRDQTPSTTYEKEYQVKSEEKKRKIQE